MSEFISFLDNETIDEMRRIDTALNLKFNTKFFKTPLLTDYISSDEDILDASIWKFWREFHEKLLSDHNNMDKFTTYSRRKIGGNLSAEQLNSGKRFFLYALLVYTYEYCFWSGRMGSFYRVLSPEERGVLDKITFSHLEYDFSALCQAMPGVLISDFISQDGMGKLFQVVDRVSNINEDVNNLINNKSKELTEKIDLEKTAMESVMEQFNERMVEISELEKKLSGYRDELNVKLLSDAFQSMKNEKVIELTKAQASTRNYKVAVLLLPLLIFAAHYFMKIETIRGYLYLTPLIGLEILVFYFMRLHYSEVRALRAQILQIVQRLSLCDFIHNYIDKRSKEKDVDDAWRSFESLIFSPIQMSAENIPSVLDGANAVADLAGKIIKGKNGA